MLKTYTGEMSNRFEFVPNNVQSKFMIVYCVFFQVLSMEFVNSVPTHSTEIS